MAEGITSDALWDTSLWVIATDQAADIKARTKSDATVTVAVISDDDLSTAFVPLGNTDDLRGDLVGLMDDIRSGATPAQDGTELLLAREEVQDALEAFEGAMAPVLCPRGTPGCSVQVYSVTLAPGAGNSNAAETVAPSAGGGAGGADRGGRAHRRAAAATARAGRRRVRGPRGGETRYRAVDARAACLAATLLTRGTVIMSHGRTSFICVFPSPHYGRLLQPSDL